MYNSNYHVLSYSKVIFKNNKILGWFCLLYITNYALSMYSVHKVDNLCFKNYCSTASGTQYTSRCNLLVLNNVNKNNS